MRLSEYKAHNTTYYSLAGVSRYRDPQHRAGENIHICLASNQAYLDAYWMKKPNYEMANFIKISVRWKTVT